MTLVVFDSDGNTTQVIPRVPQGDARREATLRDLIAEHPEILPIHDLDPSYGRLVTVTRELNIPGVGFVDVIMIDEHGRLVVVECKLWRNPQARREVVGQILDYARELSRYSYDDLQRQVSIATKRTGNVLYDLACKAGGTLDEASFVDRVTRDLAAGRFLLIIVGDGITEGTRRIGEYLRDQPGLAFSFGLVEIAEYRALDAGGGERVLLQPRVLAQTAIIERHVIRSEVPGMVIDTVVPARSAGSQVTTAPRTSSDAGAIWKRFIERFTTDIQFDDPGQPPPRWGGIGWLKVPLPAGFFANLYRSSAQASIGAEVRFAGTGGAAAYEDLLAERDAINREFKTAGLDVPIWNDADPSSISMKIASPLPWSDDAEDMQRAWMAGVANQFVNSLRPRLHRHQQEMAA